MIPTVKPVGEVVSLHGNGTRLVSISHGSWFHTAFWKAMTSSMLCARGPTQPRRCSCPPIAPTNPSAGFLNVVGLKPYTPQNAAGTRTDPPMSVPTPRREDRVAMEAPSPPDDPPGDKRRFKGFKVVPVMLLVQSRCCMVSVSYIGVPETRECFKYHDALGLVCPNVNNATRLLEQLNYQGILRCDVVNL